MQKRKNDKTGDGSFRTSPFRSLKGLRTAAPPRQPDRPLVASPAATEDDEELFLRAVNGARRVQDDDNRAASVAAAPSAGNSALPEEKDAGGKELFLQAMWSLGAGTFSRSEDEDDADRRSVSSRMRQLKKGTMRISAELDLHGFLRDEALRRLEHFVSSAYARGQQAVLVITGKGINSSEGPVLRGAAEEWLRTGARSMVAEVHPAPRDKGGSGAFVVFLKNKQRADGR